jgi:phosphoglycerol transferase
MSSTVVERPTSARAVDAADVRAPARRRRGWWPYPTVAVVALLGAALAMQVFYRPDLRLPFGYHGEALYNAVLVKALLQEGWHLGTPALGAPAGLDLREVPMSDSNLHFALMWPMRIVTSDFARAMNAYFLLTFPLTALTGLAVLRRFGVARWPAVCASLLFAFLPYHFIRGPYHFFLSGYFLVPPAVMIALWIASDGMTTVDERGRPRWRRARLVASAILCVLIGSAGVYYAFFACFFFLVAGVVATRRSRRARHLVLSAALVGLTTVVLTANYLPSILYFARHGDTPAVRRNPVDTETYGLRIAQLLLPTTGHRVPAVARFKDAVNSERGANESDAASLGVIGGLGFLALLGSLLLGPRTKPTADVPGPSPTWRDLAILNLAAVLLGTIGGFGSLVALVLTSKIRAYNRISIYIAFFALFAAALAADRLYQRYGRDRGRRAALVGGLAVLTLLGLLDEIGARVAPDYTKILFDYSTDGDFVQRIEAAMPPGAMIFQLPVLVFPENPSVHRMHDYDHARGYLRSRTLRWSYGAVRGRDAEVWQRWVADQPPPELVRTVAAAGFSGLYVNRDGYPDGAAGLTAEIAAVLGQAPIRSSHDRFLFFDLTGYRARLRAGQTTAEWTAMEESARHPVLMNWQKGCSDRESDPRRPPGNTFRWCGSAGTWRLVNGAERPRRVTLEMTLVSPQPGDVAVDGALLSARVPVDHAGRTVSWAITVPPGAHLLDFRSTAPRWTAVADHRELVFRVVDFRIVPDAP